MPLEYHCPSGTREPVPARSDSLQWNLGFLSSGKRTISAMMFTQWNRILKATPAVGPVKPVKRFPRLQVNFLATSSARAESPRFGTRYGRYRSGAAWLPFRSVPRRSANRPSLGLVSHPFSDMRDGHNTNMPQPPISYPD